MRLFLIIISLGIVGGGAYLFFRANSDAGIGQSFENTPLPSVAALTPEEETSVVPVMPEVAQDVPLESAPIGSGSAVPTQLKATETAPSTPSKNSLEIIDKLISFGYRVPPSARDIDTIVVHSSYNASGGDVYDIDKVIKQYEDYGVGAHYLIGRRGTIYRLVRENNIAYHAGVSKMPDGRENVNDFSIGIELVGTEKSGFTSDQYSALNMLISDIKSRHNIKSIVGHADIAPGRKTDPWEFDWKKVK